MNELTWEQLDKLFDICGNRRETMWMAACALKSVYVPGGAIVETGTYRGCVGDGASTLVFGALAKHLGTALLSVDITPGHIDISERYIAQHAESWVVHYCRDSITYLSNFRGAIGFLYLDSYDYCPPVLDSQLHNFGEAAAAIGKMDKRAVILCDDADLEGGGKPFLTVPWLVKRGWRVIKSAQQVLLTNFDYAA